MSTKLRDPNGPLASEVEIVNDGCFKYFNIRLGVPARASFSLFLIKLAWDKGCDLEAEADGFGLGRGTCGGDWSGIRDSSSAATELMLAKAINFLEDLKGKS